MQNIRPLVVAIGMIATAPLLMPSRAFASPPDDTVNPPLELEPTTSSEATPPSEATPASEAEPAPPSEAPAAPHADTPPSEHDVHPPKLGKYERDAAYEAEFEIPAAPTVPNPPGRQNVAGRPIKNHHWDAMEIINTDRPDFTDVLPTVKKYMWQTESGYSFSIRERRGSESDFAYHRHRAPETLIRYGLTERLELRLRWDTAFYTNRYGSANSEPGPAFSNEFLVGVKWQGILQDGWRPAHSFMATLSTRGSDGNVTHVGFEPGFNWIYGWQITKAWVIRGSTGFEYVAQLGQITDGEKPQFFGSVVLHQSVVTYVQWVPRLGTYTEWFSFYDYGFERGYQHNFGQGFYIYLTPNVQIDLRVVGTGFYGGDRFRDLTVGSGLSLRGFYHKKHREEAARKQKRQRKPTAL